MSAKKPVSEEDLALFRNAVGEVRSVQDDRVHDAPRRRPPPVARSAEKDDRSVMEALLEELSDADFLETGEHLTYARPGVQKSVVKKLRSGRYAVQSEIDLHGLTVAEARSELGEFLLEAQQRRHLCVRVVHGKGLGKANGPPRLKPAVNQWLQRNRQVLAFCSARVQDGGTGAVYVLLKRAPLSAISHWTTRSMIRSARSVIQSVTRSSSEPPRLTSVRARAIGTSAVPGGVTTDTDERSAASSRCSVSVRSSSAIRRVAPARLAGQGSSSPKPGGASRTASARPSRSPGADIGDSSSVASRSVSVETAPGRPPG